MRGRTGLLAAAATLAAVAGPAPAGAETRTITMPGKLFDPPRSTMVAGDTVVFRNTDLVPHDVRIAGVLDSGPLGRYGSWSQTLDQPGAYPFVCTLHPFMSGQLDVVAATLEPAAGTVLAGEPVAFSGRARAGTAALTLERTASDGAWTPLAAVAPATDGTFRTTAPAVEGAAYRVSAEAGSSPPVVPRVTARVDVHIDVRRSRGQRTIEVHATPAPAGSVAAVELYSPWRYAWRTARRARLDGHGRTRLRIPAARRVLARVTLERHPRGPALARSRVVRLWTGRTARDPEDMVAPGPGGPGHGGH